jgi:integrase
MSHFDANPSQIIRVGRIICFAVATAMRQAEICIVHWSDLESRTRMLLIRDRKDRRYQAG